MFKQADWFGYDPLMFAKVISDDQGITSIAYRLSRL